MNTAVFSVVYPGMQAYFPEFLDTLSKQTDRDFTLILINDGLTNIDEFLKKSSLDVNVKEGSGGLPAALRKKGIKWAMESGVKIIIFADADDYFKENRVEISRDMLAKYDLVFNELVLTGQEFNRPIPILEDHFSEGETVSSQHVRTANCMGLSNTAIKVNSIPQYTEQIPENIIAFDWALFALCLHGGAKGIFTKRTATYYRQHDNNLAILFSLKEEQILRGVQVKWNHYDLLARFYKEYIPLANQFRELLVRLQSDGLLRQRYCQAVRQHSPSVPLWWESIKTLEEVGL